MVSEQRTSGASSELTHLMLLGRVWVLEEHGPPPPTSGLRLQLFRQVVTGSKRLIAEDPRMGGTGLFFRG